MQVRKSHPNIYDYIYESPVEALKTNPQNRWLATVAPKIQARCVHAKNDVELKNKVSKYLSLSPR